MDFRDYETTPATRQRDRGDHATIYIGGRWLTMKQLAAGVDQAWADYWDREPLKARQIAMRDYFLPPRTDRRPANYRSTRFARQHRKQMPLFDPLDEILSPA